MPFVYSTASTNVEYAEYGKSEDNRPAPIIRRVIVRGGANVANKHEITPLGIVTEISPDDAVFLSQDPNFQRHAKAGFVVLRDRKHDPEVVAADLKGRDGSAPLVPADFEPGKAPTVDRKAA